MLERILIYLNLRMWDSNNVHRRRKKHNAKWMAIYNDFVAGYESGMTMVEIAKRNNVSERTIYRYKAYYDKITKTEL